MAYKTPGVYVEETSLFPPSVAQVETAIPAFIGYTEKGPSEPTKITSMLEYQQHFGGAPQQPFEVVLNDEEPYLPQSVNKPDGELPYLMHYALQMFFANGGGPCYIVSVGDYDAATTKASLDQIGDYGDLKIGLDKIRKVDEVTLIVIPEATRLQANEQYDLYKDVLLQCGDLKDRFGIFDVRSDDADGQLFRDGIGTTALSYGAAYYPHLNSSLTYTTSDDAISFSNTGSGGEFNGLKLDEVKRLSEALNYQTQLVNAKTRVEEAESDTTSATKPEVLQLLNAAKSNTKKALDIAERALELLEDSSDSSFDLSSSKTTYGDQLGLSNSDNKDVLVTGIETLNTVAGEAETVMEAIVSELNDPNQTSIPASSNQTIKDYFTNEFESRLYSLLNQHRLTMPPSSTIAGIYAKVDADRGVWKAPANVSVNNISGPAVKLTMSENDDFNVHATGKSINVIRSFTGKGTLVWGARTLDGNSNEWKYVPVRRFFNMVEESVKKASEPFVFESNDANTWVKVKAMIENFLVLQWRAGALMGAKPDEAFFVKVGLGETMTQQHVLDGEMIVEIGMAVVRPAEFIILRFSHKMLES